MSCIDGGSRSPNAFRLDHGTYNRGKLAVAAHYNRHSTVLQRPETIMTPL